MEKLKTIVGKMDGKKLFIMNLPYFLIVYFMAKIAELYDHMSGFVIIKLVKTVKYVRIIFIRPFPTFRWKELLFAIYVTAMIKLAVSTRRKKKFRNGKEYGAARWDTKEDIAAYIAPVFYDNMILSDSELLTLAKVKPLKGKPVEQNQLPPAK